VVLGFLNDDPAYPVVLGSLYSSQRSPPYQADAPNTYKAMVTKAQLKITMEDVKKIMTLETPGGHKITLSDEGKTVTLEDLNGNKLEMAPAGITLDSVGNIGITAKGNITLSAQAQFKAEGQAGAELSSTAVVKVQGALVQIN